MLDRFPAAAFERMDESPDPGFYVQARMVLHIDEATVSALSRYYGEQLFEGAEVLDLMSSWVSHLPPEPSLGRVAGLGMNAEELAANPRLSQWEVRDLNTDPGLPYADASFDFVLNAVSVQYLKRPIEVFREVARVLRPGGLSIVAMSHRCFPTKAVRAFHGMGGRERMAWVAAYHEAAGGFGPAEGIDRSPPGADPLWLVSARGLGPG